MWNEGSVAHPWLQLRSNVLQGCTTLRRLQSLASAESVPPSSALHHGSRAKFLVLELVVREMSSPRSGGAIGTTGRSSFMTS